MMKKIFLAVFILISIASFGQGGQPTNTQFIGSPNTNVKSRGWLQSDSGILHALRDTIASPVRVGEQRFRVADSTLYTARSTTAAKKWYADGSGSGNSDTVITKGFATISALKSSSFYTTSGSLIAIMQGYNSAGDGGGVSAYWDASSSAADNGIDVWNPTGHVGNGRWRKIYNGVVRALEAGIKNDGTDQTGALNILLTNTTVKRVLFDNGNVTISSTFYAQNKDIEIKNGAMLKGSGILKNANIIADARQQIFDTTLTIQDPRNTYFSIMWTGCKMDSYSSLATNNYTPFMKALGAINTSGNTVWQRSILYVPGATDTTYYGYHYGFKRTIKINTQVTIVGDNNRTSVLVFPGDSVGITMQIGSSKSVLKDLGVWGRYAYSDPSNGYNNPNSAGILVQSNGGLYENLWINGFDGDGIQNVGDVNQSTNSNNNHYLRNYITYCGRYGMFFAGGDANQCTIDHCDIVGNARNSIYENSFLGNYFVGCHSASNGSIHPKSRSTVRVSGVSYFCTAPNKNVQPGVTSGWQNYWVVTSGFYDPAQPQYQWNATDSFFVGGSFLSEGANQRGLFAECYAEDDECKIFPHQAATNSATLFGFAEGYIKMTTGGNHGFAAGGWQTIDTINNVQLNMYGTGYESIHFYDVANNARIGWIYNKTDKTMVVDIDGVDPTFNMTKFAHPLFNSTLLGLSTTPRGATLFRDKAFWRKETGFYNSISMHDAVPASGEYAAGDFVYNGGSDTTLIGWICRTSGNFSGTPPVFSPIKNPNSISGGGGGSYINNGSTLQTSAQFNIDGQGKAASFKATTSTGVALSGNGKLYDNVSGATNLQLENATLQVFPTSGDPLFYLYNAAFSRSLVLRVIGNDGYISPTSGQLLRLAQQIKLDNYGVGTYTGTPAYDLASDASGKIIERTLNTTAYTSKATSYTATIADCTIEVTATGQTITLPTAVGITGKIFTIKLTASGTCTIGTTSSQNIDGSTTYTLASQYKYATVQSNGTGWLVIANN